MYFQTIRLGECFRTNFKFCCKVLELAAADSVFSRASTASSSHSRVWKIPICSSCFSKQSESDPSGAFSSFTESRGRITSSATITKLASHLGKINSCIIYGDLDIIVFVSSNKAQVYTCINP
jgi:hypothetical protein